MSAEPLVLTVEEAAALLRVSTWTVGAMTRDGRLAKVPGLRRIRIPYTAILALTEGYIGTDAKSNGEAAPKAPAPRRRHGRPPDGSLAQEAVGSSGSLARPIGPAEGDVVVRVVEGRSR